MSQLAPGSLHKFLTGETVTGDDTQIATNINIAFELLRLAHNDTDTRSKDTYTKSEADGRYYSKTQLDAGQLDNRYFTETELNAGQLDNRYFTETELNAGQLDTRYYTESELNAGQLDTRYYTEGEVDSILAGISPDGQVFNTKAEMFTATEGQTVFTLTQGSYVVGQDRIQVYVSGVKQYLESGNFTEISPTSFGLSVGVPAGTKVEATWMQGTIVSLNDIYRSTAPPTPVSLVNGLQVFNNTQSSPLNNTVFKGRTLANLLGRSGNCEDDSKWVYIGSPSHALNTSNYSYGSNSIALTASSTSMGVYQSLTLTSGKYYILLSEIKNNTVSGNLSARLDNSYGNFVTSSTKFSVSYVKFSPSSTASYSVYGMYIAGTANGQIAYVDGVRLYEISQAEYNALGTTLTDINAIAAKYPYVDDVKPVNSPYIIKVGENQAATFNEWILNANAVATKPYELVLTSTATNQSSYYAFNVVPNTDYTLSMTHNGEMAVYTGTGGSPIVAYTTNQAATFNSGSNTQVSIYVRNNVATGTFTFTNPMLNLGATAKPFRPRNDDMIALPNAQFHSNVDQTIYDEAFKKDGKWFVKRRFKDLVLDGSLTYSLFTDGSGFKRFTTTLNTNTVGSLALVKYDGKPLKSDGSGTIADTFILFPYTDATYGNQLMITIPDADSGFGETFSPSAAEISAFMYGYKLNNGTFGTPYNGSGTKTWTLWNATNNTGSVTTVPTAPALNFTPYKLTYQLATPTFEEIQVDAGMSLHEGLNQIEVGQGVVVREKVTPIVYTGNYYWINNINVGQASYLKNRALKILAVYKNGKNDNWLIQDSVGGNAYGNQTARTSQPNLFDPTATYEVSYIALDQYLLSAPVQTVNGEVASNLKTVVDLLTVNDADQDARISALEINKARKVQGQWIAPTLLNGWVEYSSSYSPKYMKDEFGYIHVTGVIKSGTVANGIALFILPQGYRPSQIQSYVVRSNNGTSDVLTAISIDSTTGSVTLTGGSNSYLSIAFTPFLAEQ